MPFVKLQVFLGHFISCEVDVKAILLRLEEERLLGSIGAAGCIDHFFHSSFKHVDQIELFVARTKQEGKL